MQLRVTLSRGDSFHNVLITADATATATDVATAILSEGLSEKPRGHARPCRSRTPLGTSRCCLPMPRWQSPGCIPEA